MRARSKTLVPAANQILHARLRPAHDSPRRPSCFRRLKTAPLKGGSTCCALSLVNSSCAPSNIIVIPRSRQKDRHRIRRLTKIMGKHYTMSYRPKHLTSSEGGRLRLVNLGEDLYEPSRAYRAERTFTKMRETAHDHQRAGRSAEGHKGVRPAQVQNRQRFADPVPLTVPQRQDIQGWGAKAQSLTNTPAWEQEAETAVIYGI